MAVQPWSFWNGYTVHEFVLTLGTEAQVKLSVWHCVILISMKFLLYFTSRALKVPCKLTSSEVDWFVIRASRCSLRIKFLKPTLQFSKLVAQKWSKSERVYTW